MFASKSTVATLVLPFCLLFAQSSSAEPSFTKKYAPYIGYEHGFTTYKFNSFNKEQSKYTPRFFVGVNPIQKDNYKMGLEMGYTLPASYEESYIYGAGNNFTRKTLTLDTQGTDAYFTFQQSITQNSHWFIKPGLEYTQRNYEAFDNHGFSREFKNSSLYMNARAGVGYNFKNGIVVNLLAKSRFVDFKDNDHKPKKFMLRLNAEYAF